MKNAMEKKTGCRELSDAELDGVAGGKLLGRAFNVANTLQNIAQSVGNELHNSRHKNI